MTTQLGDAPAYSTDTREGLFTGLLSILEPEGITSDINYYAEGKATAEDYRNLITVAFERTEPGSEERKAFIGILEAAGFFRPSDNLDFWINDATSENAMDVADLANAGEQRLPVLLTDQGGGVTVSAGGPDETVSATGVGGNVEGTTSILTSREMEWFFDSESGEWYVAYGLPNSDRRVFFSATGSEMDAIFGEGIRPTGYTDTTFGDLSKVEGTTFGGGVAQVQGKGTFETEVEKVVSRALDEGVLPDWARNDPAVMDILFIGVTEEKGEEWIIEQIATLPSFANRFPGIDALTATGLNIIDAVTGFLEMETGIKALVTRDGGDPNSITPDIVGGLLQKGHSLTDVEFTFGVFDTMEKNAGALDAFNEILVARGMDPLDADQQFDFMAGNAAAEIYDIWEESSLHRAAMDAGLTIGVQGAIDLAARTEGLTSYEAAYEGLTAAAQNLLRFRTQLDLGQYGLEEQDLIDMSLGLAPSSGTSQATIARSMERAVRSAQAQVQEARINPFKRFTAEGVPQAASLSRSSQEQA